MHNQTITKGPDALRYIADTSFEDFVKYSRLRVEEVIDVTEDPEVELISQAEELPATEMAAIRK